MPFRGVPEDAKPFLGKVSIVVNVKYGDPITQSQMPGLNQLVSRYAQYGLHVLAFPTDQGWFEVEDGGTSDALRLLFKKVYDFGTFPTATVFDKVDLLGANAHPLYAWMTRSLPNPWGLSRIALNYEKFLLDADGVPVRRYPRQWPPLAMEADVRALLEGKELPSVSAQLAEAWEDAKREANKSEYAFRAANSRSGDGLRSGKGREIPLDAAPGPGRQYRSFGPAPSE